MGPPITEISAALATAELERFQSAWDNGPTPSLEQFLSNFPVQDERCRKRLLVGLIAIDIVQRWQRHAQRDDTRQDSSSTLLSVEPAPFLEDYANRFDGWVPIDELPPELVCQEYRARHCWGDKPSHKEYLRRFPHLSDTLPPRLATIDKQLAREEADTRGLDQPAEQLSIRVPSRRLGDYELIAEVASGGMGVVYRARQLSLNRIVALKVIRSSNLADEEEVRRFHIEAEAAARLDHPAIVPVYEVGEVEGLHFYSMAFVAGPSLAARISQGPLAPRQAAELLLLVTEAMHYAHSQGVIHRDLKPGNILLVEVESSSSTRPGKESGSLSSSAARRLVAGGGGLEYFPKITDFGLAKQSHVDSDLTSTGQILGTPSYMPPEQARGDTTISPANDIYSLGAVLYAMLTGRPPFQAASVIETVQQVIADEPVAPRRLDPSLDQDIETICLKCLQKVAHQRYTSASELAADLQRYLNHEPIHARPVNKLQRLSRWCRRNPAVAALLVAASGMLILVVALAIAGSQLSAARERSRANQARLQAVEADARASLAQLEANRHVMATQEYYAFLNAVRERFRDPAPGWARASLTDLKRAASLPTSAVDRLELRCEAVRCLSGIDLSELATVKMLPGYRSHLVQFAPTGSQFAVATLKNPAAQTVTICEVPSGRTLHALTALSDLPWQLANKNHDGIRQLSFLQDGAALAILTRSGWVHRWDLTQSPPERSAYKVPGRPFVDHDRVEWVFDACGNRAFYAVDNKLYEWPAFAEETATEILDGHVRALALGPGGRQLAVCLDEQVRILATDSKGIVRTLSCTGSDIRFSSDGRLLALLQENELLIVDAESGMKVRSIRDPHTDRLHDGGVSHFEFSRSGTLLVTSGRDQTVKLWDVASGREELRVFVGGTDNVHPVLSPDELHLVTTGDMQAKLFELQGLATCRAIAGQAQPIRAFDVSEGACLLGTLGGTEGARESTLAVWNCDGDFSLVDMTRLGVSPCDESEFSVAVDGTQWGATDPLRDQLWTGPFENGRFSPTTVKWAVKRPTTMAFATDNPVLLSAVSGDTLVAWDFPSFEERWRWSNQAAKNAFGRSTITSVVGNRECVAACSAAGFVNVFRAATGATQATVAIGGEACCVALRPDNELVACGASNGNLFVARVDSGDVIANLAAHSNQITDIAFSNDLLATASRDKTIRLWQVSQNGCDLLLELQSPSGPFRRVRFSADGSHLIALVQGEAALRVWHLTPLRQELDTLNLGW